LKAGIIAAGEGSRLKSEGITPPKPLVAVNGIPLIERLIRSYIRFGITEIACIVNEASLEVKRFVESKRFPVPVRFVVKSTPSSMHSLFALAPLLGGGPFLLSTVDSIFNEDEFGRFLASAADRTSADGILAVTDFVDDENPLYVQVDRQNTIISFGKGEGPGPSYVTGGLYIFSPRIFGEVDSALKGGIERLRNFLGHLIARGFRLEAYPFSKIIDIDHAADIRAAEELLGTS
jgi:NDP-sugar pyrophosphorylase family protein